MDAVRLGDVLDDYCTRCRLLTDHSVVAIVEDAVKKVRCRTCNHEHDYRQGQGGQKKKTTKLSAYEQVLASVLAGKEAAAPVPPVPAAPVRRRSRPGLTPRRPLRPR
jgi:hypothetical protein